MKRRVAELIPITGNGGVETLVKDYALLIDKQKFDLIIITMQRVEGASVDNILSDNKIRIIPIYKNIYTRKTILARVIRKINDFWFVPFKVCSICKKEQIDVLHIHRAVLRHFKLVSRYLKKLKVKLIYTCHCIPEIAFSKKEILAAKYLIKYNDLQILALHEEMRDKINSILEIENVQIIRNGIDYERFKNVNIDKEQYKHSVGIKKGTFVIGNIGRFEESKNHEFLIDIFYACYLRDNDVFLLLIGDGYNKSNIIRKLNDLGLKSNYLILSNRSDIPQLLHCMDVFVFPSKHEGFGIVAIEAQVAGIRCIISDCVPKEVLQTDLAISVSLDEPPEKWAKIIMDNSIHRKGLGHIEDYNMNYEIKKLEKLYLK